MTTVMEERLFSDAVFRLGQLGGDKTLTNHKLLRRVSRILIRYTGADVAGVAVHELGMSKPASATYVAGPWSDEQASQFLDWSTWCDPGNETAARLTGVQRNRIYTLDELLGRDGYHRTRLYTEFHRPLKIVAQAFGVYRRPDGCELFVAINALEASGELTETELTRFTRIAPYIAKAWAGGWHREPNWARELKSPCRKVLELVLQGFDDDQIAERTGLTYHAVRAHLKRLFRAAGVRSRLHLMQQYRVEGSGLREKATASPSSAPDVELITVVDPSDTAFGISMAAAG